MYNVSLIQYRITDKIDINKYFTLNNLPGKLDDFQSKLNINIHYYNNSLLI